MTIQFQLREHKTSATYNPNFVFSKPSSSVIRVSSNNASIGASYIFVVCSRAWLHGKKLRWTWTGQSSWSYGMSVEIYDGEYDRASMTDFPNGGAMALKGNGKLQELWHFTGPWWVWETPDCWVDTSGGVEDNCTIFFKFVDNYAMQWALMQIDWVEINTAPAGAGNLYREDFDDSITMEKSGGIDDYGYISSGDLPLTQNVARALSAGFWVKQDVENLGGGFITRHATSRSLSSAFLVCMRYDLSLSEGLAFYWWGSGTSADTLIDLVIQTPTGSLIANFPDGPAEWRWVEIFWSEFKEVGLDGSRPDKTRITAILWTYHTIGLRRVDRISSFRRSLVHSFFTVRQTTLTELGAGFSVRRSSSRVLKASFFRGSLGVEETKAGFVVRKTAARELSAGFNALQASSELKARLEVGQGFTGLVAGFLVVENFLLWIEVDGP